MCEVIDKLEFIHVWMDILIFKILSLSTLSQKKLWLVHIVFQAS